MRTVFAFVHVYYACGWYVTCVMCVCVCVQVKSKAWMKEEEGSTEKGFQVDLAKVYLNSLQRTAE